MAKALTEYHFLARLAGLDCVQAVWLAMIEERNRTSHTYCEALVA